MVLTQGKVLVLKNGTGRKSERCNKRASFLHASGWHFQRKGRRRKGWNRKVIEEIAKKVENRKKRKRRRDSLGSSSETMVRTGWNETVGRNGWSERRDEGGRKTSIKSKSG